VLYRFSPVDHGFYPRCPFYLLTGRQCPGCGATRALYFLLHGNFAVAWAYNQLFVAILPLVLFFFIAQFAHAMWRGRWHPLQVKPGFIYAGMVLVLSFAVIRNL